MKKADNIFQVILTIFFIILAAIWILPFLITLSVSFSSEKDIVYEGYKLIPKNIDFSAYRFVFSNPMSILQAYKVTFIFSFTSMVLGTLLIALLAYPLTRKEFKARKFLNLFVYLTMLFSGGLVPSYILITRYLHLGDSIWVYILPSLMNVWYVFMIRSFFSDIPEAIYESARIDGANEFVIFFRIVLPLSKPALATVALFTFLAKWNDWFTSMLYINDQSLISLQYLLQRIMNNIKILQESAGLIGLGMEAVETPSETARMAMAVVVAGPALVVFPFFQKYFVKGLTLGSVKG